MSASNCPYCGRAYRFEEEIINGICAVCVIEHGKIEADKPAPARRRYTQAELSDMAIARGAKLRLPEGVHHIIVLIDGPEYREGEAGCAASTAIANPAEALAAGAVKLKAMGFK